VLASYAYLDATTNLCATPSSRTRTRTWALRAPHKQPTRGILTPKTATNWEPVARRQGIISPTAETRSKSRRTPAFAGKVETGLDLNRGPEVARSHATSSGQVFAKTARLQLEEWAGLDSNQRPWD